MGKFNRKLNTGEEQMREYEDTAIKAIQNERKDRKKERCFSTLWDNDKQFNIHVIGVQEGRKRKEEKIMEHHLSDLIKTINSQIQEAQQRIEPERKEP